MRDLNSVDEDEIIHQPTQTTSLEQVSTQPRWAPETSMLGEVGAREGDEKWQQIHLHKWAALSRHLLSSVLATPGKPNPGILPLRGPMLPPPAQLF